MEIYGSYANGLSIESSDIDLALKCYAEEINLNIIKLTDHFKKTKKFEKINPIITASVPVIKLVILSNFRKLIFMNFSMSLFQIIIKQY